MSHSIVYNIPVVMIDAYRGRSKVVRSHSPGEIADKVTREHLQEVVFIQILDLNGDIEPLMHWGEGVPVDLIVQDPQRDLPLLYRCSPLPARHPVRVSIPVVPGCSRVVKLAVSLDFAVKLEGGQPEPAVIEEMLETAAIYLHQSTVSQPIEYFHSLFLALYRQEPVTLWGIQEEDPSRVRYITDEGEETLSRRFIGLQMQQNYSSFLKEFKAQVLAEKGECFSCGFFENCCGYFKWPRKAYSCSGVKRLLQTLKDATTELKRDLAAFHDPMDKGRP